MLDYSSWHSTDIVLATATATDGIFEVLEVWKGDLGPGAELVVPELKPALDASPIWHYPEDEAFASDAKMSKAIPKQMAGSRLVLFLKRTFETAIAETGGQRQLRWQASNLVGDMKASVVWMNGSRLYRFIQMENPGPSTVEPWDMSEADLRARVSRVIGTQRELTRIAAIEDGATRAEALRSYLRSGIQPARMFAEEELGNSGRSAVPAIRAMIDDPSLAAESGALVKALARAGGTSVGGGLTALARAGGTSVGGDLTALLDEDLNFWRAVGPSLRRGWWNDGPNPNSPLRNHYDRTIEIIRALDLIRFSGALGTAKEMRAFWRSLPQLNDPSGLNQLSEDCGKLVHDLQ
jgi:hypothetical protein